MVSLALDRQWKKTDSMLEIYCCEYLISSMFLIIQE